MFWKLENGKSLRYGVNYSFTSDGVYRQCTLKLKFPYWIKYGKYYDLREDSHFEGRGVKVCIIVMMFALSTGTAPRGTQIKCQ